MDGSFHCRWFSTTNSLAVYRSNRRPAPNTSCRTAGQGTTDEVEPPLTQTWANSVTLGIDTSPAMSHPELDHPIQKIWELIALFATCVRVIQQLGCIWCRGALVQEAREPACRHNRQGVIIVSNRGNWSRYCVQRISKPWTIRWFHRSWAQEY